jgi:hypothetical protein
MGKLLLLHDACQHVLPHAGFAARCGASGQHAYHGLVASVAAVRGRYRGTFPTPTAVARR